MRYFASGGIIIGADASSLSSYISGRQPAYMLPPLGRPMQAEISASKQGIAPITRPASRPVDKREPGTKRFKKGTHAHTGVVKMLICAPKAS